MSHIRPGDPRVNTTLLLHCDGPRRYYAAAVDAAEWRGFTRLSHLLAWLQRRPAVDCHVLGDVRNAELAINAAIACEQRGVALHVSAPRLYRHTVDADMRAQLAFMAARSNLSLPACVGGWHRFTSLDVHTYAVVADPATVTSHPAWPAISFLPGVTTAVAADLISEIVDPRWYVDPQNPSRSSRLRLYLGASPRWYLRAFRRSRLRASEIEEAAGARLSRCELLCRLCEPPLTPDVLNDTLLVDKIQLFEGLSGVCRAVSYIRYTWLDRLQQLSGGVSSVFDPKMFFKNDRLAAAYVLHVSKWAD